MAEHLPGEQPLSKGDLERLRELATAGVTAF